MKKLLFLILIVGVVILMALTKPDKKAHKEAMMKAIAEYVDDKAEDSGLGNNVLTDLGKGLVRSTISLAMDLKLKLDDYFVANATHIRLNGEDKMLSLGLFGKVITFDKEMLRDALENGDKLKQKDLTDPDDKEALREAKKAEKEFLKEAKRLEKEAKKAAKEAEKEAKRMAREAEKAAKDAKREAKAAVKEAMQDLE